MKVTRFNKVTGKTPPDSHPEILEILNEIKSNNHEELVKKIKHSNKDNRRQLKIQLPSFFSTGQFTGRNDKDLIPETYTGFITLDIDGIERSETLSKYRDLLTTFDECLTVFKSPSGKGIKAIFQVDYNTDKNKENHKKAYSYLVSYLLSNVGSKQSTFLKDKIDGSGKNIARHCYLSHDPDIYINENNTTLFIPDSAFNETNQNNYKKTPVSFALTDNNKIVEKLLKWFNSKYKLEIGKNINSATTTLLRQMNSKGVNKDKAKQVVYSIWGEIYDSVDETGLNDAMHIYETYKDEFNNAPFEDIEKFDEIKASYDKGDELTNEQLQDLFEVMKPDGFTKFWSVNKLGSYEVSDITLFLDCFLPEMGYLNIMTNTGIELFKKKENGTLNKFQDHSTAVMSIKKDLRSKGVPSKVISILLGKNYLRSKSFFDVMDFEPFNPVKDTFEYTNLFYRNKLIRIDEKSVQNFDYSDFDDKHILDTQIIGNDQVGQRDFNTCDGQESKFSKFLRNAAKLNYDACRCAIGYLVNNYKDKGNAKAVIFNDSSNSRKIKGGTGKSLVMDAISQVAAHSWVDGKQIKKDDSFLFSNYNAGDKYLLIQDVKRSFDFEKFFSVITDGFAYEQKFKDKKTISFYEAPKIAITSNYFIQGYGNAYDRRKYEIKMSEHYKGKNVGEIFGGQFFSNDWDSAEWARFDSFIIGCVQLFLSEGLNVKIYNDNEQAEKLAALTDRTMLKFVESDNVKSMIFSPEGCTYKSLFDEFLSTYAEDNGYNEGRFFYGVDSNELRLNRFENWMNIYFDIYGIEVVENDYYYKGPTGKSKLIDGFKVTNVDKLDKILDIWESIE